MKILFICVSIAVGVLSFVIVLNSHEQPSRLYPGTNVRFCAAVPGIGLFFALVAWLFPAEASQTGGWYIAFVIMLLAIFIVYGAWVESAFQAGLVKRMMHAVVVDKQGKPIDFNQALLRNVYKWLLVPLAPLSLYLLARDFRRQALHDKLAGTVVMWTPDMIKANQPKSSYEVDQVYERRGGAHRK
jgi:uncharacterized RDD family membrane protein YckC